MRKFSKIVRRGFGTIILNLPLLLTFLYLCTLALSILISLYLDITVWTLKFFFLVVPIAAAISGVIVFIAFILFLIVSFSRDHLTK